MLRRHKLRLGDHSAEHDTHEAGRGFRTRGWASVGDCPPDPGLPESRWLAAFDTPLAEPAPRPPTMPAWMPERRMRPVVTLSTAADTLRRCR